MDIYDNRLTRTNGTNLSTARYNLGAATIEDFGLFAGGADGGDYNTVDVFNVDLTRTTTTSLSYARSEFLGTSIRNRALFGGGSNTSNVDVYQAI